MIGVDAHRRPGKFCLHAELHSAGQAKARCRLAAHTLGEGSLALGMAGRNEAPYAARQRARTDKTGAGLGEQAHMDVVANMFVRGRSRP